MGGKNNITKMRRFLALFIPAVCLVSCQPDPTVDESLVPTAYLHEAVEQYTDVIVHDIFSPPTASRNYVYAAVAGYEVVALSDEKYQSLTGQLRDLSPLPAQLDTAHVSYRLASLYSFLYTARSFVFSEEKIDDYIATLDSTVLAQGVHREVLSQSQSLAAQVSDHILDWSRGDNYAESRSYSKHAIKRDPASWKPTAPAFMEGIEPHWQSIRPMVLQAADQFVPEPPTEYATEPSSRFYQEVVEVYEAVNDARETEKEIASFWDCNPYVMNQTGHVMYASKKITPGGHWMGIAGVASQTADADWSQSMEAYVMTALALFDGFISCWDEKYRSNLVRPETYIHEHIDPNWKPLLQTPPFPEYTSGHSVISTAAAVALTEVYGEDFAFDDRVELKYGLPVRSFPSFRAAAAEAAISRLYGGIHYRPAIEQGVLQGKAVGDYVVSQVTTRAQ